MNADKRRYYLVGLWAKSTAESTEVHRGQAARSFFARWIQRTRAGYGLFQHGYTGFYFSFNIFPRGNGE